ncbi:MAG: hypothetical protein ACJA08_000262 [Cyclobacteriaceae bacterium]|jgi:hypothetical protein
MSFFDQVYQKIFVRKAKGLILHEVLKRSQRYTTDYERWKNSDLPALLLNDVADSLRMKLEGLIRIPEVYQFSGDYSNGIAITYNSQIDEQHFHFLFDLFAERVKELGYRTSISDLIVTDKKGYVESKEKHYLKTKISNITPIDQKFGNVIIELILIDDKPSFIRFMAHAYNDRLYKTPDNFKHLAEYLLATP